MVGISDSTDCANSRIHEFVTNNADARSAAADGPIDASFRPAVAVAADGRVAVALPALSNAWPVVDAMQPKPAGATDVYVAVLDPDLQRIVFATFLGGQGADVPQAVV